METAQSDVVLESRQVTDESAFPIKRMPVRVTARTQLSHDVMQLQLHLDELSHVFETPEKSYGLLKLRATLSVPHSKGARLIAQRSFSIKHPSVTPDAAGGVRALRQALEQLTQELDAWVLLQSTLTSTSSPS